MAFSSYAVKDLGILVSSSLKITSFALLLGVDKDN